MWLLGLSAVLTAASETDPPGTGDQQTIILGGIIVAAITGVVTIVVALINAHGGRTGSSPAPTATSAVVDMTGIHEDIAVLRYRADDNDGRDDVQDHRHNVSEGRQEDTEGRVGNIERYLDLDHPGWRHRDRA